MLRHLHGNTRTRPGGFGSADPPRHARCIPSCWLERSGGGGGGGLGGPPAAAAAGRMGNGHYYPAVYCKYLAADWSVRQHVARGSDSPPPCDRTPPQNPISCAIFDPAGSP
eukprot:gene15565-biopygen15743